MDPRFDILRRGITVANDLVAFDQHFAWLPGHKALPSAVWTFEGHVQYGGREFDEIRTLVNRSDSRFGRAPTSARFNFRVRGLLSWIVRIRHRRDTIATVLLQRATDSPFSPTDCRLLDTLARLAGDATYSTNTAALFDRLHVHFLDGRTHLQEVQSARELLDAYLEKVEAVCHPEIYLDHEKPPYSVRSNAKLINSNKMALHMRAFRPDNVHAWPASTRSVRYQTSGHSSIASRIFDALQSFRTNKYHQVCRPPYRVHRDVRSHISAPIAAGTEKFGVITVEATKGFPYTRQHEYAVSLLAAHASRPLGRAMDRELAKRRSQDLDLVASAMADMQQHHSWTSIQRSLQKWLTRMGYHRGLFCRVDHRHNVIEGDASWGDKMRALSRATHRHFWRNRNDCQVRCVQTREPQPVTDPLKDPAAHRDATRVAALGPFVILPFVARNDRVHWTLHVERDDAAPIAQPEIAQLLELCRAAVANVERASERVEQSRRIALDRLAFRWSDEVQAENLHTDELLSRLARFLTGRNLFSRCVVLTAAHNEWKVAHCATNTGSTGWRHLSSKAIRYPRGSTISIHRTTTRPLLVKGVHATDHPAPRGYRSVRQSGGIEAHKVLRLSQDGEWIELPLKRGGTLFGIAIIEKATPFATAERLRLEELGFVTDIGRITSLALSRLDLQESLLRQSLFAASMAAFGHEVGHALLRLRRFSERVSTNKVRLREVATEILDIAGQEINAIQRIKDWFHSEVFDPDDSSSETVTIIDEIRTALKLVPVGNTQITLPRRAIRYRVTADRHPLCLILVQLLANSLTAFEATVHPQIRIRCAAQPSLQTMNIFVEDNGSGFSARDQSRLSAWLAKSRHHVLGIELDQRRIGTGLLYAKLISESLRWSLTLARRQNPTAWKLSMPIGASP